LIIDRFGRQFRNLRLSLTAACNYACTYCVPDGKRLLPAASELSAPEMVRLVRLIIETAGITKLRITGGEPLLSPKFDQVFGEIMNLGLEDVSLTTNGQLVLRKLPVLLGGGLKRINVSLDTLDAERFRSIARSGDLASVLDGIEALQAAGVRIKVNMVPMKGVNDDQILPLLEYCMERDIELRFIELMNMGHLQGSQAYQDQFFGMQQILDLIKTLYPVTPTDAAYDSTAVRYQVGKQGRIGIIANESAPFCQTCSRLRLSSNGKLFGCLSNAQNYDLRELFSMSDSFAVARLQQILGNALDDKQSLSFRGEVTVMKFIGG
jgi:cyclic pyranopterin phosphate synthase